MQLMDWIVYIFAFLFGLVIGSFLNVVIFRLPKGESLSAKRSHCMSCGYQLRWFDLIPLFSWLALRGHCRKCHEKISVQYPLIEAANAILYVAIFAVRGIAIESIVYCFTASALLALSVIDFRTYIIPIGFNIFILVLAALRLCYRIFVEGDAMSTVVPYLIGMLAVSVPLGILWFLSKGRAIGGGDVKLMGAAGLLLGWKGIIAAFVIGCIVGSVVHLCRMRLANAPRRLAMGPYLAVGIITVILVGEQLIGWYTELLGF